jgi:hypothetical protein
MKGILMMDKLRALREQHLKALHNTTFYPYQKVISDNLLKALIQNLRLTTGATEEDIKKLKPVEVPVEISRQAGKTTAVVYTIEFVMIYFPRLFKLERRLEIAIFSPQIEQAKTDFDRLKEALMRSGELFEATDNSAEEDLYKKQNNSKTIVMPNGATCYIAPVSPTSLPESKSLALMVFEESQDLNDKIVQQQIWPMGATTNAPRIYIGTAGTRLGYFRKLGRLQHAIKIYFEEIATQRRLVYQKTGDATHLIYEQYVRGEIERHGLDADEIQRPYFGKWLIGTGNFTTEEDLLRLEEPRNITYQYKKSNCFAGIDTAKHPDSTVVTIIRDTGEAIERKLKDGSTQVYRKKEIINWMELRGENYKHQFEIIENFLSNYNVVAVAIDSTGQGDFMPDMFETDTEWSDENSGLYRMKFSLVTKDILYKNLKVQIQELLTTVPKLDTKQGEKFKQQMLDLQQEYKGNLLSVHHPKNASDVKEADLHDDYPDSWALAEWAFAKWYADNDIGITVVSAKPERKVVKNEDGEVTDHWPGETDGF